LLPLTSKIDYDLMILKAQKLKDITINISVVQLVSDDDKENAAEVEDVLKHKKLVRILSFLWHAKHALILILDKERPCNFAWKRQ